ncbi:putative leader peptide [Streptomyces indicus]|uniref:putative leader peptide n=1 Tax=Streptomyces indicus TaxID=417292 RepID=UPI003CCBE17C
MRRRGRGMAHVRTVEPRARRVTSRFLGVRTGDAARDALGRPVPERCGGSAVRTAVDRCAATRTRSCVMQPLGGRPVPLVARRHVDLVRVASAICCA